MTWIITAKTQFYLHDGESLLDGLVRTGHRIDYQCKQGYCGHCRIKNAYSSQPITYKTPPLALLNKNEILACCCEVQGVLYINTVD